MGAGVYAQDTGSQLPPERRSGIPIRSLMATAAGDVEPGSIG
ncbi:hypothetical protein [Paenibacillus sp. NPDC093718]